MFITADLSRQLTSDRTYCLDLKAEVEEFCPATIYDLNQKRFRIVSLNAKKTTQLPS